jgi:diguanylate cyclase (GGDEF)-like protein
MIDIDDFKQVNDQYGHLVGDEVLRSVGHCINGIVREMDLAARYGGEELAIILPNSNIENAYMTGERVRKAIKKLNFDGFSVTVSIGVSSTDSKTINTPESVIKKADEALYRAKESGKNKTIK